MNPESLLEEVIAAHGGRERWRSVTAIEFSLQSAGFAFASHGQPSALRGLKVRVLPHQRIVQLRDYCRPGWSGEWSPHYVAMRNRDGALVSERHEPRTEFRGIVKNLVWDKLDILYFAGYALWNYLSFPFVLAEPGVKLAAPGSVDPGSSLRLAVEFPASLPTHSARQLFHFDEKRLLTRHDYTADVIGKWATAANCILASEVVDGLRFYTRRKVYPRMGARQTVWPFPLLVWIEIDDLAVHFAESTG